MTSAAPDVTQYLGFVVRGEEFALPILRVVEIVAYAEPNRVPNAPPFLRGVLGVRGAVIPIVDLSRVFGFGDGAVDRRSCVVLCEIAAGEQATIVGVLAEAMTEVVDVPGDALKPAPAMGAPVRAALLLGLIPTSRGRFAFVLDVDRVLSEEELAAACRAKDDAPPAAPELAS